MVTDLKAYAEHDFKLSIPDKDGITEREHLETVERQIGRKPLGLEGPPFPEPLEYVWSAFLSLNNARGTGFSGPLPISYTEMHYWSEMTGTQIDGFLAYAVKELDKVYMRVINV